MINGDDWGDSGDSTDKTGSTPHTRTTRRGALALAGAGLVGGLTGSAAAAPEVVVSERDGWYGVSTGGETIHWGTDLLEAIQIGVDSLTDGRTWKETVRVDAAGTTGSADSRTAVDLPSYTVLDVPGTIEVDDSGEPWVVPVRARGEQAIEIPRLHVAGNPRYGIRITGCSDVTIGDVNMDLTAGLGIRIDGRSGTRTTNVTLESATISGASTHAVETYGVDGIDVGTVAATDIETGCGLLLNDTTDASVGEVRAIRCDQGGGYAGFRCANGAGPGITVDSVTAVDCGRGVFTVSGSGGIEIRNVRLEGCGSGALLQDSRDVLVENGTVAGNGGEGIRIDSRSSDTHHTTRNVTVRNLAIRDNGSYGVRETGPGTAENAIVDNAFSGNASTDIETYASSTVVRGNTIDAGSDAPIESGIYRIRNVHSGKLLEVARASTDHGATVRQYSATGSTCQHWWVQHEGGGVYTVENVNSDLVLEVNGGSSDDGATLQQWGEGGGAHQRWRIVADGDSYALVNDDSGKVADVYAWATDDGADVVQWTDNGGANQRWTFESV